jgi:hypothetical protein
MWKRAIAAKRVGIGNAGIAKPTRSPSLCLSEPPGQAAKSNESNMASKR